MFKTASQTFSPAEMPPPFAPTTKYLYLPAIASPQESAVDCLASVVCAQEGLCGWQSKNVITLHMGAHMDGEATGVVLCDSTLVCGGKSFCGSRR